jgi:hypothetical protein
MDGRAEDRFPVKFDVTITDLERPDDAIPAQIADISCAGIRLLLAVELKPGTTVKLDIGGSSLFGHVVYSNQQRASFYAGIEVTRVLFGENELAKLLHAVLAAQMPAIAMSPAIH